MMECLGLIKIHSPMRPNFSRVVKWLPSQSTFYVARIALEKLLRKLREKYHSTMHQDTAPEVGALKNLLAFLSSVVLAHFILKEWLHNLGIPGCVMFITGSVVIVIHAPRERAITSVQEIWNMATQPAFLLYAASVIVLVFVLVFHFALRYGHSNVLIFMGICSLMGSLQVMSVKALETSLKLTFDSTNQSIYLETWFFMLVVFACVITQMNYLNKVRDSPPFRCCPYNNAENLEIHCNNGNYDIAY